MARDELAVRKNLVERNLVDPDGTRLCHSCDNYHGSACCVEVEPNRICGRPTGFGTTYHGLCDMRRRGQLTRDEYRERMKLAEISARAVVRRS